MSSYTEGTGSFTASAAVSAFRGVTLDTDRKVAASATAVVPLGWTARDAEADEVVPVRFFNSSGTVKVSLTGAPVTANDIVYAGASGQVTRTGGTVTVGRALQSASSNGSIIEIQPFHIDP